MLSTEVQPDDSPRTDILDASAYFVEDLFLWWCESRVCSLFLSAFFSDRLSLDPELELGPASSTTGARCLWLLRW